MSLVPQSGLVSAPVCADVELSTWPPSCLERLNYCHVVMGTGNDLTELDTRKVPLPTGKNNLAPRFGLTATEFSTRRFISSSNTS